MTVYRFQNTLQGSSQLAKDRFVNTLYVSVTGAEGTLLTTLGLIGAKIQQFFGSIAVANLSKQVGGTSIHTVKSYDMSLPPGERVPLTDLEYNLTCSQPPLPAEVALVLTLEAARVGGVEPMSTRGRWFVGPLASQIVDNSGLTSRPSQSAIDAIVAAGVQMISQINLTDGCAAIIASTRQHKVDLAPGARKGYFINSVSMDNSWDTQRSRGDRATSRSRTPTELAAGISTITW